MEMFKELEYGGVTLQRWFIVYFLDFFNTIKKNEIVFVEKVRSYNEDKTNTFKIDVINNGEFEYISKSNSKVVIHVFDDYIPFKIEFKFKHYNEKYSFVFPLRPINGELYIDGICRIRITGDNSEILHCSYYHRNQLIRDDECFFDEDLDIYEQNEMYFPTIKI